MPKNYDVDYFIKMFKAIPSSQWTAEVYVNDKGQRCAMGHCWAVTGMRPALRHLFEGHELKAELVNDGLDFRYLQRTPKARILAALKDIKKGQRS